MNRTMLRPLLGLILVAPLLACEPHPAALRPDPHRVETPAPQSGITISGSARVGVSGRF
ncbi:hypothetical protein KMP13_13490 [Epibacterium ulvae]|uniref:hypothetical protein n=1 Tax=Epibacterium ulvae TaxID=1156985 RepID=UPI001BFBFE7A|nr:hypothetical protein [Epibacterium ulvae]MBT8154875.1 hypothetical protein [Epibacterium ulvae]